jgi:hypothetical protein
MFSSRVFLTTVGTTVFALFLSTCKPGGDGAATDAQKGLVKVLTGSVELVRSGQTSPLKKGDALQQGDSIRTGSDGLAIIVLYGGRGEVEIQENAVFTLTSLTANGQLDQEQGNAWIRMTKLASNESLKVITPTAIAGVRGTKFYNFTMPDGTTGTCQCEGSVDYDRETGFNRVHEQDSVVLNRGDVSIVLTADDMDGIDVPTHNHSTIPDSTLGPKNDMTPEQGAALMALINKKFAEAGVN